MASTTTKSILSTTTKMAVPFLRKVAGSTVTVDVNRHCIDMTLSSHKGDSGTLQRTDLTALHDVVMDDCASVVVSWPVSSEYGTSTRPPKTVLNTLERTLRESHDNVTTTRPFFMLDGGGRRMASLTLLRRLPTMQTIGDTATLSPIGHYDCSVPGDWLKHYSSLRSMRL
jgi:hypothetical protein